MPKVWIAFDFGFGEYYMSDQPPPAAASERVEVEMNGSLYRQIKAAQKKHNKHQTVLGKFFNEAQQHPDQVRRVG